MTLLTILTTVTLTEIILICHIFVISLRPDDVWIVTYPKCGTTWTQEILWQILNDLDLETVRKKKSQERSARP